MPQLANDDIECAGLIQHGRCLVHICLHEASALLSPNSAARSRAAATAGAEKSTPTTLAPNCASAQRIRPDMTLQMQDPQSLYGPDFVLHESQLATAAGAQR